MKLQTTAKTAPRAATRGAVKNNVQREVKPAADDIRRRAYEIYLERQVKGRPGTPESDWQQAERELSRR
jgi:hypothetical protein